MISSVHQVCKQGYYVAIISTNQETNKPETEINAALELLGPVKKKFFNVKKKKIKKIFFFIN
jgi:Rab GDP dissociation inhibitor